MDQIDICRSVYMTFKCAEPKQLGEYLFCNNFSKMHISLVVIYTHIHTHTIQTVRDLIVYYTK